MNGRTELVEIKDLLRPGRALETQARKHPRDPGILELASLGKSPYENEPFLGSNPLEQLHPGRQTMSQTAPDVRSAGRSQDP